MTLYGATDPQVIGQPISPFFGAQQNVRYAGAPVIPAPVNVTGPLAATGAVQPVLDSVSRGSIPMNACVNTVNGVSPGGNPAFIGSDPVAVAQLLSNGNGSEVPLGASLAPAGAINTQIFVDGIASGPAVQATGPTPTDTAALTQAPVSGATIAANVALFAQQFEG